jgi:hypothetical protein
MACGSITTVLPPLVVDEDLGILKFTNNNTADAGEHLMTTLKLLYTVSEDWTGAKYCVERALRPTLPTSNSDPT